MVRLYHFTSRAALESINQGGFVGSCWFAEDPSTIIGEEARQVLLEVELSLSEAVLAPYRHTVKDEILDPLTEEPTQEDDGCEPYHVYEIPAAVVNVSLVKCRVVPPHERKSLVEGL